MGILSGKEGKRIVEKRRSIGCYTDLRYSDFSRLTTDNIKGNYIEIKQQKTGKPVAIPVHPVVRQIPKSRTGKISMM